MTDAEEYGLPHEVVSKIRTAVEDGAEVVEAVQGLDEFTKTLVPYDLTPILKMYAADMARSGAIWWSYYTRDWTPEDFARHERRKARRNYWRQLKDRLIKEREKRIERQIITALGRRHWEWYEQTLHDDCGDW
jgi:hypothetical protein